VSIRHLRAVFRKEVLHIFRDRSTFILVLLTPISLLFIMAYALTVDIQQVPVAVLDRDESRLSRRFVHQLTVGEELDLHARVDSLGEIDGLLRRGQIKAGLIIRPAFERQLITTDGAPLQILIDGTEPESGAFAMDQIARRADAFVGQVLAQEAGLGMTLDGLSSPIQYHVTALYNPALKPRVDMVPGLISLVLGFPALSVALTLAHEREHGTLEQVMVTPVSRAELLIGKMLPYLAVGMVNVVVIPLIALLTFDIPFNGSFSLFFLLSIAFLFAMLSMGTLVGVFMRTQPAALALSFLVIFFPGFFMTGIFFPLASMPAEVRLEAMFLPGTHYAVIARGVFLRAAGLAQLWPETLALLGLGILFVSVAAFSFRKKLA
jgi:ABC-2 type transport system permease protein